MTNPDAFSGTAVNNPADAQRAVNNIGSDVSDVSTEIDQLSDILGVE